MAQRVRAWFTAMMVVFPTAISAASAEVPAIMNVIGWRGDGGGRYPNSASPSSWDDATNVNILWRAVVGKGQSNPTPTAGRIFVTAEPDRLLAIDAATGQTLWRQDHGDEIIPADVARPKERPMASSGCGYATPTPVTDGNFVWASFGTGVVVCYDMDGHRKWIQFFGEKQITEYGRSASPVLVGGKLVVSMAGLIALNPATGGVLWRNPAAKMSYGTPIAARVADTDVLFTPNGDCVRVSDGKILARRLAEMRYASPIIQSGVVYCMDTFAIAYRMPELAGETISPAKAWESDDLEGEYFASPVYHDGILYTASNQGVFSAIDVTTGKLIYKKDLPIRSAIGDGTEPANVYPSLALVGGLLLVGNDAGETLVLQTGRSYREICHNRLKEGSGAAPVASGDRLYLRGGSTLYAIRLPDAGAAATQPSAHPARQDPARPTTALADTPRAASPAALSTTVAVTVPGQRATLQGDDAFVPSPQHPTGWRGDGTGLFPGARPPLHWGRACRQMRDFHTAAAIPADGSIKGAAAAADGFFTEWLVAAPLKVDGALDPIEDLTPAEALLAPVEGDKIGQTSWQRVPVDDSMIDVWKLLGEMHRDQAAYVQGCLYCSKPTKIWCQFNHALGVAFWFNGTLKHKDARFPVGLGQMGPTLKLELKQGWNRFLFKLTPRCTKATDFPAACFVRTHFWLADEPREYDQNNIAWISPMPGLSQAMPVIVGDRIFTTAHLYNLICVDKKAGQILWIRSNSPYDAATAPERQAKAALFAKMDELAGKRDAYYRDYVAGKRPAETEVKAEMDLEDQLDAMMLEVDPEKYKKPDEQGEGRRNWWEMPTPTSDGTNVCIWLSRGTSACYDLQGNRRWIRYSRPLHQHHGFFGSPVIADGKLFILDGAITALDLTDGSAKFSFKPGILKSCLWFGSITRAVVGETEFVLCPSGRMLIRARDGLVFGQEWPDNYDSTPFYLDGQILVANHISTSLYQVKPGSNGEAVFEKKEPVKWPQKPVANPGFYCGNWAEASPIIYDGLGYMVNYSGVLAVFDVKTMEVLYQKELPLDLLTAGAGWNGVGASLTMAGGYVYVMGPNGVTVVLKPGRQYQEVARNRIQLLSREGRSIGNLSYFEYNPVYCHEYQESTLTSTPAFQGTRMYVRGQENLYCIEEK